MAFLIKSKRAYSSGPSNPGLSVLAQWTQVSRAAKDLPQSTSEQLFRVYGGRVLVHLLLGEVTTVIQSTDPQASIDAARLDDSGALVGTSDELAATLDMSSDEVGTQYVVEGDGTALVSTQVASFQNVNTREFVMPQGQIVLVTAASKTGALKWDIWYQPLDAGAYVQAVDVATVAVT